MPGIAGTVNLDHIKMDIGSHLERNPTGIVPVGPESISPPRTTATGS